ncbi:hypothetical protein [Bradyrhizobium sp. 930_D9_N1_4]|uniref:hypothetical protein n=1 Tax=Bradyrhizobium sp. 930_D9_N1_4 TaxID=3240374 RepID=UPI003F897305
MTAYTVMAGLVPAIHALTRRTKNVDARAFAATKRLRPRRRDKPGHDGIWDCGFDH